MFRLRHAMRVRFTVVQVFPVCRVVGFFTVRGHAGLNRVRFNGRVHGKRLPVGTYQIGLRTRSGTLRRVTVAIFDSTFGSPSAVAAARKRNVCGAATSFTTALAATSDLRSGSGSGGVEGVSKTVGSSSSSAFHHVLGAALAGLVPTNLRDIGKNPFAIGTLALAMLLLGLAAVPKEATPGSRMADLLARRRSLLALAGAAVFAVGVVILALG